MGTPAGGGGRGGFGAGGGGCGISPDNGYFVDVYQTHDTPPATRLVDAAGKTVAELAKSDLTKYTQLGFKPAEMFTYTAADGKTRLHGLLQFPSNFDPAKKYPALVSVYGGPASASNTARETFVAPNATAEYGFLILNLDSRSAPGQGKRTLDDVYLKLGQVEIDDMAEGVKSLYARPYFDKSRVGIYGTSYGGYASVMSILRHPGRLRGGLGVVAGDRLVSLRQHLHRAVHVDAAGEQRELRQGQRDVVCEGFEGPAAALLRHGGQQCPPVEHDAADQGAAGRRQEL